MKIGGIDAAISIATALAIAPPGADWPAMLRLPSASFVGRAYVEILGRPADPSGYKRYLRLLRSGGLRKRLQLVRELLNSDEARNRGLSPGTTARAAKPNLKGLLEADSLSFVERSFEIVNQRAPDEAWRAHCTAALRAGVPRAVIVGRLRFSAEGVARGVRVRGLFGALLWHRLKSRGKAHPMISAPRQPRLATSLTNASEPAPLSSSQGDPATGQVAVFTIAAQNYLPYVRVLMASVRALHPDFKLFLILADEPPVGETEAFTVVPAARIGVPCFDDMTVRYNVLEFCTALKPFAFRYLFDSAGASTVIYLDPDIRLYSTLSDIQSGLASGHSLILTPHVSEPLDDGLLPDDHQFLRTGVFNLGFAAARRCEETQAFVDWWAEKLRTNCRVDFSDNLFTDQRWCDLAPCFLPNLLVLRDPGFNVAYWNLTQRPLSRDANGTWLVADRPLVFFHFSGLDMANPEAVSKHQNRLNLSKIPDSAALFHDYIAAVRADGAELSASVPWAYGIADNGARLPEAVRELYRAHHPLPDSAARTELLERLRRLSVEPTTQIATPGGPIPGLLSQLYRMRLDLQRTFDATDPDEVRDLLAWYQHSAVQVDSLAEYLGIEESSA